MSFKDVVNFCLKNFFVKFKVELCEYYYTNFPQNQENNFTNNSKGVIIAKMKYSELIERLQKFTKTTPTQSEFCRIIGLKPSTMSNRVGRNSDFSVEEITKLNCFYGVNLFTNTSQGQSLIFTNDSIKNSDVVNIPVRVNTHAEPLTEEYTKEQIVSYPITRKQALDIGINVLSAEIIIASGDSMYPTIEHGDTVLIDTNKKEIYDSKIYCVKYDNHLYIKRLQKIPPSIIYIVSDNPKYKGFEVDFSKEMDFDFQVIGEVRWWGRIAK